MIGDAAFSHGDIMRRLRDLERDIRAQAAGRRLEASSIGRGGLALRDGGSMRIIDRDGSVLGRIGDLGDGIRGTWIGRANGEPAIGAYGTGVGDDVGFAGLYDRSGQYVVTDDASSGRGLARPYIPIQVGEVTPPTATTTSSTFESLAEGMASLQHPCLVVYGLALAGAGTAGEVRVWLDHPGPVGPVTTIPTAAYTFFTIGPFALPSSGEYGTLRNIQIQARRTAGTGTLGVRVLSVLGLESSWAQA
ncbi:hypothetical protein AWW66_03265 [Micromonospora rosaria]|uniref:Uncharacterized protein n=1 Tax=Micromonospora rosaria TaxID=47874 RepID=A0A136PYS0_9ACTN|nr:hypothetical protein AWW66_03265 [Micromonospora rosaria]